MKKIISGRMYDTEKARKLAAASSPEGPRDFRWWSEELYQKRTGEFFLFGEGGAASRYAVSCGQNSWKGGEKILPLSYDAAKAWAEEHLEAEEYEGIFGAVAEDAEDVMISLKLPAAVDAKLRRMAAEAGISLTAQIIKLIENEKEEKDMKKTFDQETAARIREMLLALDAEENFDTFEASPVYASMTELCELLEIRMEDFGSYGDAFEALIREAGKRGVDVSGIEGC